jgi:uncharacterized protein YndB with AHSA1/START domain
MTSKLPLDFFIDKEKNQIRVAKTFAADLSMVWDMWTKAEFLDQWWAPKPYRVETKFLDFKPGGRWFYAMISPENESHWCIADYKSIEYQVNFTYSDAFADENEVVASTFPSTDWSVSFTASNGAEATQVNVLLQYASLEDLEKIIEFGFREGFSMGLENLDELLLKLKAKA